MQANASRFNRSEIMRKAHADARMIARPGKYREVFALRLRQQWRNAKEAAFWIEDQRRQESHTGFDAAAEARRLAILEIETKDRLMSTDFARLAQLRMPHNEGRCTA